MSSTCLRGGVTSVEPIIAETPVTASAAPATMTPLAASARRPARRSAGAARLDWLITLES